jgi:hypothetical protein
MTDSVPRESGWFADPEGRHELRYFDGAWWTANVADGGIAGVDGPQPAVPRAVQSAPAGALVAELLIEGRERPKLSPPGALCAGAGALVALAAFVAAVDGSGDVSKAVGAALEALVIAIAYVVIFRYPKPFAPAAIAAASLAVPFLFGSLLQDRLDDGKLTAFALLTTAAWIAMFFLPGMRGRPWLQGLALYGVVVTMMVVTSSTSSPFADAEQVGTDLVTEASALALILGAGYLVIGAILDRRARRGIATPFVAVGIVAAVTGALGVAADLSDLGGIALFGGVGVTVFVVGAIGDRRGSTWLGAAGITLAGIALVAKIVESDDTPEGPVVALLLVLVAAVMILVAGWYSTRPPRPAVVAGGGSAISAAPVGATTAPVDDQQLRGATRSSTPGVVTCPNCGEPTRPGAAFCAVCRQLLP